MSSVVGFYLSQSVDCAVGHQLPVRCSAERRDGTRYEIVDKAYVSCKPQTRCAQRPLCVAFSNGRAAGFTRELLKSLCVVVSVTRGEASGTGDAGIELERCLHPHLLHLGDFSCIYLHVLYKHTELPMDELTPRQRQVLRFIQEAVFQQGMPPTRAEIAEALGFKSANAAEEHLRALQRKGVLDLKPGASRGIQLRDSLREQLGLPLIGRVAAGKPILAEENIETHYRVDPQIFSPRAHYLLKVRGMSMKGAGILDGDLVAVHRTPEVRNRQIIVARLENEVTVKRYKQDGSVVWLMPENDDFEPMRVDLKEESLIIEGIVVGVVRQDTAHA